MRIGYKISVLMLVMLLSGGATLRAQSGNTTPPSDHSGIGVKGDAKIIASDDLKWSDAPPVLPAGAKMAVLDGDPMKEGYFTIRLRIPPNYKIMPHWHPAAEHITVLSGEFVLGMGDKYDADEGTHMTAGSFAVMPPLMHHFAHSTQETVLQMHGIGPWQLYYLNQDDDPRATVTRRGGKK